MNDIRTTDAWDDDDFSLEEELFRTAFDRHANDIDEPVVFEHPRPQGGRRSWWIAAVAIVSLASLGTWYATQTDEVVTENPTLASPTPSPSLETSQVPAVTTLPTAKDGFRWTTGRNVAVQVPQAWTDDTDNCFSSVDGPPDDGSFVLRPGGNLATKCDAGTQRSPLPYLAWSVPGEGQGGIPNPAAGAVYRVVQGVLVQVAMNDGSELSQANRELATQILTSAVTFSTDQNACPVTSPITPRETPRPTPWQVSSTGMTTVGVCLYNAFGELETGATMTAAESDRAATLLDAIAAAPAGTTPGPSGCESVMQKRTLIRVTNATGVHDLYLYNSGECSNYVDDGTTRRQVTSSWCLGLYTIGPFDTSLLQAPAKGQCIQG